MRTALPGSVSVLKWNNVATPYSVGDCALLTPLIGKGRCSNADCAGGTVTACVAGERDGCDNGKRVEACDSTYKTAQVCTLNVSGGNSTLINCGAAGATGAACVSTRQFHVVRNEDAAPTENDRAALVCDPLKKTIEYWSGVSGATTHCSALTKTASATLARNANCTDEMFRYTSAEAADGSSNSGILEMTLELTNANGDEKVRMQREVFVGFQ